MKKTTFNLIANILVALLCGIAIISCEREPIIPEEETDTELVGELTVNRTLLSGNTYHLSGGFHVKNGATLTIEKGVIIEAVDDNIVDYILIEQGAKINAQGTADAPIVMTSQRKSAGAWGGLHICGKAPINVDGGTSKSEIGDAVYGGSLPNDNSGVLRYLRIEYAGYNFSEEKEGNGFTFYGVGNGTTAEYLQAYQGSDDGFEWFGGTMNVKYLVSTSNSDDSFDWTEGWCGKGQFMVAYQAPQSTLGYDCDALIEADNNSNNFAVTPVSHPILSNLTLVGNNSADEKRGIRLRAGTQAEIYNALVTGKSKCLTTQTAETENSLVNGTSVLAYIHLANTVTSESGSYSETLFLGDGTNGNDINQNISFTGNFIGTINGGQVLNDSFFETANYKGAVPADHNWTSGWTK